MEGIAALLSALVGLVGGSMQDIGSRVQYEEQTRAAGQQAATLDDIAKMLLQGGDYGGLKAQASRTLTQGQNALAAQQLAHGIYNSGEAQEQNTALTAQTLGQLAQSINSDKLARTEAAGGIYSNPAFGYYNPKTGKIEGGK